MSDLDEDLAALFDSNSALAPGGTSNLAISPGFGATPFLALNAGSNSGAATTALFGFPSSGITSDVSGVTNNSGNAEVGIGEIDMTGDSGTASLPPQPAGFNDGVGPNSDPLGSSVTINTAPSAVTNPTTAGDRCHDSGDNRDDSGDDGSGRRWRSDQYHRPSRR
jgi:hypothetical protein